MKRLPAKFSNFLIRNRLGFLLGNLIFAILLLFSLRNLSFRTNLGDFVPQKHPFIQVQNKLTKIFGGLNQVSIAIEVKEGNILNTTTLTKVYNITRELYLTPGINAGRVVSLSARKIKHIDANDEGFNSERLMHEPPKTERQIEILKQRIVRNPLVYGPIVSKDLKSTLIQADFESDVSSKEIFTLLRNLTKAQEDANHKVYLAGMPILEGWLDYYLPRMGFIFILMFLIMAAILYIAFRSKRGVVLPLVSAGMATVWGLALMSFFGYQLGPTTILVPFLVLALGISHSVQFIKRYYEYMAYHRFNSLAAAQQTTETLFVPAVTSLITDGIGFLSLFLIPLGMVKSMAIVAAAGILGIFFSTVTFIPVALSYLPIPRRLEVRREEKMTSINKILSKIAHEVADPLKRLLIFICILLAAILGVIGMSRLVIGDNQPGSASLYPQSEYNQAEKFIADKFAGSDPYYILVAAKSEEDLVNVKTLQAMESLQRHLESEVKEVGRTLSLVDYIKGMNMVMFAGDFRQFRIPALDRTIAEYLFLYSLTGFPGDFNPVISPDYLYANIKADVKDHQARTISRLIRATGTWVRKENIPNVEFLYAGGVVGMLGAVNEIIAQMLPLNIAQVGFLVFLCVSLAFGSFTAGAILLIPLAFSVLFTFGLMGLLNISLTVETLPVAALGIGLGVDYGIYVVSRLRQELLAHSDESIKIGLIKSLTTSGKAVFFTGATIVIGVFSWLISNICLQARLGAALGTLLLLNMIGALVILPALLVMFKPKFLRKKEGGEK
ncbi:MAG: RND family transporter [Candidatus Omnitrophica bacterium]|nr:RND family transporter [Candidatus Omnitrophota bacterium]